LDDPGAEFRRIVVDQMAELRTERTSGDDFLDDEDEG